MDIARTGKSATVERHFNIQPAQQETLLETLNSVMADRQNGVQTAIIELILPPVVERQRAAQHLGAAHHVEKTGAQMAHDPPVVAVFRRGIGRQRGLTEIADGKRRGWYRLTAIQQCAL